MYQCMLTYVDDLLCFSATFDDHLRDLDAMLCRAEYYGLQLKPQKCILMSREVPYLGHLVIPGVGIKPNPKKIEAIRSKTLNDHNTKRQLKSFLMMCNFFRKFVPRYNEVVAPLQALLNEPSKRAPKYEAVHYASFKLLQDLLCDAVLAHVRLGHGDPPLIVATDASKVGLAAVLLQVGEDGKEHPLAFISRSTTKTEKGYYSYHLETLAIVWALRCFRQYVLAHPEPTIVRTDCQAVTWLLHSELKENNQVQPYINSILEYNIKFRYKKGSKNPADYGSRNPLPVPPGYYDEDTIPPIYSPQYN